MVVKTYPDFPNFYEIQHPIIQYKLSLLREYTTNRKLFKELTEEVSLLLGYEATCDLRLTTRLIQTPLEAFDAPVLENNQFVVVPILRAGLGMADGILKLLPMASVGHIGYFRDEKTLKPTKYYFKLPTNCERASFFICDPMLATGGTACATIKLLKEQGIKNIKFICLVIAPEGLAKTIKEHPDVFIYAASLDRQLNSNSYILPGLGDAGDRLWAVK